MSKVNRSKTHCPEGHPYDEENTYTPPTGGRYCRACMRRRSREWRARNLELVRARNAARMRQARTDRRESREA